MGEGSSIAVNIRVGEKPQGGEQNRVTVKPGLWTGLDWTRYAHAR